MPLPPALLKRLAKRGIVDKNLKKNFKESRAAKQSAPAEEIIAEDYDDVDDKDDNDDDDEEPIDFDFDYQTQSKKSQQNFWSERLKRRIVDGSINGYKGCPNKYNIHHKCSLFCVTTFGDGIKEPSINYLKRKSRLLQKHPLPNDWKEVYDSGVGVHYYWNVVDDTVSWLPPSHGSAVLTKSAATLRKELEATQPDVESNETESVQAPMDGVENEFASVQIDQSVPNVREPLPSRPPPAKKQKARDLDKVLRSKNERRQKKDKSAEGLLDPMDPAAYSDIPRGKWSAGLENENKKSGVDSTVSGAFQMRPYPSPGMVLQANAQQNKDENFESDNNKDNDNDQQAEG